MQTLTMHPNGRTFASSYSANPNKKRAARLAKRVKDYAVMVSQTNFNATGYKKPGSMNK